MDGAPASFDAAPQWYERLEYQDDIRNGYLVVPRFQRPLVWTDEQRLELFRSVLGADRVGVSQEGFNS